MLVIVSGPAGGTQRDIAEGLADRARSLWIVSDLDPPAHRNIDRIARAPWNALIAMSERFAHPAGADLWIHTLDGFGTEPRRRVTQGDHTPQTSSLSRDIHHGRFEYGLIVLGTLSGLYDEGAGRMAHSAGSGNERALEASRLIASNALAHLCWNLQHSGIPTLALCWNVERTLKGKVTGETPNAPRRVIALADAVIGINQGIPALESGTAMFRRTTGLEPGQPVTDWRWLTSREGWTCPISGSGSTPSPASNSSSRRPTPKTPGNS